MASVSTTRSCSTYMGEQSFDLEARCILDAEGNHHCFAINLQEVDPQKTVAKMSCPMPDQSGKVGFSSERKLKNEF